MFIFIFRIIYVLINVTLFFSGDVTAIFCGTLMLIFGISGYVKAFARLVKLFKETIK